MARFLAMWNANMAAPWPTDPSESVKLQEQTFTTLDEQIKTGELKELGFFPDGNSGIAWVP